MRPAFSAKFSCERVNRDADCLPFVPMRLCVHRADRARQRPRRCGCAVPMASCTSPRCPIRKQGGEFVQEISFAGPFPERAQFKLEIPGDLRDDAGRRLTNQKRFPLTVKTDVAPPLAKFPARFGIIELNADAVAAGNVAQPGG